jgi:hypothetical protein
MNIAYIITAHKNPTQLVRMIEKLGGRGTSFWIHFDKKQPDSQFREIRQRLEDQETSRFIARRNSFWGDFSQVEAILACLRELVAGEFPFDHAVHLTGQDYPIKQNQDLVSYLQQNREKSFMDFFPLPTEKWPGGGSDRYKKRYHRMAPLYFVLPPALRHLHRHLRVRISALLGMVTPDRRFPEGLAPYGGDAHWCLSRRCVEYVLHFVDRNPSYVNFFKSVFIPDETFFHTILLNSPLKDTVLNVPLHYIDWSKPTPPYPAYLTRDDFTNIIESGRFFARKFDSDIDAAILDMIDSAILGKGTL